MKRRPKSAVPEENPLAPAADATAILQVKVWLTGISPMVWRRVLVPSSFTLRELHGVIQVAMGWEGIHLYDFQLRAARYGSWEVAAASPDVTLVALRFRKGARFIYEYDLNISPGATRSASKTDCRRRFEKPIPSAPGAAAPVHPRIAAVRRASWPVATTDFRSMRWRTWTPWSRFSSRSR
jgi:hypothetical protein